MGSYSRRSVLKAMGVGAVGAATGGSVLTANSPRAAADTLAWVSDFETGDFSQWSWWGGGPPDAQHHDPGQDYGKMNVITAGDPLADGVTPHGGQYFSRYEVVDNTNFHAKVYKTFTTQGYQNAAQEVSTYLGTYSSWYYIPTDYQTPGTATLGTWVNIFQFKTVHPDGASDPLWYVGMVPADFAAGYGPYGAQIAEIAQTNPHYPICYVLTAGTATTAGTADNNSLKPLPLGRWFEIRTHLTSPTTATVFLDGHHLVHTSGQLTPPAGDPAMIFGIGHYSEGVGGKDSIAGPIFADDASFTERVPRT